MDGHKQRFTIVYAQFTCSNGKLACKLLLFPADNLCYIILKIAPCRTKVLAVHEHVTLKPMYNGKVQSVILTFEYLHATHFLVMVTIGARHMYRICRTNLWAGYDSVTHRKERTNK